MECRSQQDRLLTEEFTRFALAMDPDAGLGACAVGEAGTFADARRYWCSDCRRIATTVEIHAGPHRGHHVGLGQKKLNRARGRLGTLARKFMQPTTDAGANRRRGSVSRIGPEPISERRRIV
jgi:hypothetical protein